MPRHLEDFSSTLTFTRPKKYTPCIWKARREMSSGTLTLNWKEFGENIAASISSLREEKDFSDVTLVCGSGSQQVGAHKVILSACSPFFKRILQANPHSHPLIYLKGVKFADMQSILKFMYLGKADVESSNLDIFLAVAQELEVKGLTQLPTVAVSPNNHQPCY